MAMSVKGKLLRIRSYSFKDKDSGQDVQGAKIVLATVPEKQKDDQVGMDEVSINCLYDDAPRLMAAAKNLVLRDVEVECDIIPRAKGVSLRGIGIKAHGAGV